jgi:L-threonylcarbamoyladenylate synthase
VVFPSDTVYGLLVDVYNEEAVRKLIAFKNRPPGKPISVFVDWDFLYELVLVSEKQKELLKNILPGPFTVVLRSKGKVCPLLESEKKTLGVRIPDYQPVNQLIKKIKKPVTATSANLSGRPPHYSIESLLKQLPESKKKLVDFVVDAGKLPRNKPSTVIDLVEENIKILRQGDILFTKVNTYLSRSEKETKKIAQFILGKLLKKDVKKPLIFIIEGDLGVGKTVFVKGMGEVLGIKNIVSPSFVVMYEYEIHSKLKPEASGPSETCSKPPQTWSKLKKLIHLDLYNVEEKEEFEYLKIEKYLAPGNLLAIEWGEKVGEIFDLLKEKGEIVYVKMRYESEKERVIEVKFV